MNTPLSYPMRNRRGLAAMGTIFHATNGDGVVGKDYLMRVCCDGKRQVINLGPDPIKAQELDALARLALRDGKTLEEVKRFVAEELSPTTPAPLAPSVAPSLPAVTSLRLYHLVNALEAAALEGQTQPGSKRDYLRSLFNAVELVQYYRAGATRQKPNRSGRRVELGDYGHAGAQGFARSLDFDLERLGPQFAADFRAARKQLGPQEGTGEARAWAVSTETELRQLNAVFTAPWAQEAYRRAELRLTTYPGLNPKKFW